MDSTKRIIINTSAQYIKAVINICLSLYATRLVLQALDIDDYGIFSVVGGVVAMLGFVTNALIVTTQRYLSFYHGKGDTCYVRQIFKNSLFLHIVFAVVLSVILASLCSWLFDSVLNICLQRLDAAIHVYYITIAILATTVVTAPFKSIFIARENIVFISIVDVCDGVIKFLMAILLLHVTLDRLVFYAYMMLFVQMANLLAFAFYALCRFDECDIMIRWKDIDREIQKQLIGFLGWTCYGAGAVAGRNQGTAVVLNHFCGTGINAAYGIATHVYGAIAFIVTSLLNAMNPQIMKAEGSDNRQHSLTLAMQQSKFSTAILAIVIIPIIAEITSILDYWLVDVPPNTGMFCVFILVSFIIDQTTLGLNAANQATGDIRLYTLITYTPKLLFLPVIWWMLAGGCSPMEVMALFAAVELLVAVIRLPYSKWKLGLNIRTYIAKVVVPLLPLIVLSVAASLACACFLHFPLRFLLTLFVGGLTGIMATWRFTLTRQERDYAKHLFHFSRNS